MPLINVRGTRIHYTVRGQGEPLLLLMGLGTDGSAWEEHVLAWESRYRCILVDNRGTGRSDAPAGPYSTLMMADDASGVISGLGISRAHVAGISMGGAIAQEMALNYPSKVRSLVLVSTWPRCENYTANVFEMFTAMRAVASPAEFTRMVQLWIYAPPYYRDASHTAELLLKQQTMPERAVAQHAYEAQAQACASHDTLDRLEHIAAPTLITVGELDIFTPMAYSRAINERVRSSEMAVFPECGHVHHWEDLARFNQTVLDFLARH